MDKDKRKGWKGPSIRGITLCTNRKRIFFWSHSWKKPTKLIIKTNWTWWSSAQDWPVNSASLIWLSLGFGKAERHCEATKEIVCGGLNTGVWGRTRLTDRARSPSSTAPGFTFLSAVHLSSGLLNAPSIASNSALDSSHANNKLETLWELNQFLSRPSSPLSKVFPPHPTYLRLILSNMPGTES